MWMWYVTHEKFNHIIIFCDKRHSFTFLHVMSNICIFFQLKVYSLVFLEVNSTKILIFSTGRGLEPLSIPLYIVKKIREKFSLKQSWVCCGFLYKLKNKYKIMSNFMWTQHTLQSFNLLSNDTAIIIYKSEYYLS
jgi:hypothetical protein